MKRIAFIVMVLSMLLVSCSDNEPRINEQYSASENSHFVPLGQALETVEGFFTDTYGARTRSASKIKGVEVFLKKETRNGSESFNGLYFVNYDSGFAILSADDRRPTVLAFSDEGSVSLNDTINNKGFADYISQIYDYEGIASPNDLVVTPIDPQPLPREVISKPLIKGLLAKLSQGAPYNNDLGKTSDGTQALVGCGPLSIGVILGYYRYPNKIENFSLPWYTMLVDKDNKMWPKLFCILGSPAYAAAVYEPNLTTTYIQNIAKAFVLLGYKVEYGSSATLNNYLKEKRPAVISGEIKPDIGEPENHTFIVDGGFKVGQYISGFGSEKEFVVFSTFYSIKWGFGGDSNGYYLFKDEKFDCKQGEDYKGEPIEYNSVVDVYNYMFATPLE